MSTVGAASTHAAGSVVSASTPEERDAALSFLQQLASELSNGTVELPGFPGVVVRISKLLADPKTTSENIVSLVGTEPRLAARLLQTANSAAYNTAGKPLTELRSAVTRIGQQMVQSIAMSFAVQQMQNEKALAPIAQRMQQLWQRSIAVAAICQLVAERTKVHTDTAFLTGLLHGIGSLYILARSAAQFANSAARQSLIELLESWNPPIGRAVLENWGFDETMCEAVGDQRDHDRKWKHDASVTDVLIVGIVLEDALRMPEPRVIGMEGVNAFASIGLSSTDCEATLVRAERRIARVYETLR